MLVFSLCQIFRNFFRNIGGVWQLRVPEYSAEYRGCFTSFLYSKSGISTYSCRFVAVLRIPHCKFPHIPAVWRFHFVFMMSKQLISCVDCWFRMRERFLAERSRKNAFGDPFSPSKAPFFCSPRVCGRFSVGIFREYSENIVGWQENMGGRIWWVCKKNNV